MGPAGRPLLVKHWVERTSDKEDGANNPTKLQKKCWLGKQTNTKEYAGNKTNEQGPPNWRWKGPQSKSKGTGSRMAIGVGAEDSYSKPEVFRK